MSRPSRSRSIIDDVASRLVLVGLLVCVCGVPLAMAPGSYNRFGPIKMLVLVTGVALIAVGLSLDIGRTASTLRSLWTKKSVKALAVACAVVLLSVATSSYPLRSFIGSYPEYTGAWVLFTVLFVVVGVAHVRTTPLWRFVLPALLVSIVAVCAYALVQAIGIDPLSYRASLAQDRLRSTLGNASNLGVYLLFVVPVVVSWLWSQPRRLLAACALLVGVTVVLVWTGSRGALMGALAAALSSVLLMQLKPGSLLVSGRSGRAKSHEPRDGSLSTQALVMTALIVGAVLLATVALTPGMVDRMKGLSPASEDARWRLSLWDSAAQMVADRPILGWGPDSFRYTYPLYRDPALSELSGIAQTTASPHNIFLDVGVASGIAGLVAFGALGLLAGRDVLGSVRNRRRESMAAAVGMIGGLVALQFHFLTLDTAPLVALLLGIILGPEGLPTVGRVPRLSTPANVALPLAVAVLGLGAAAAGCGLVVADHHVAEGFGSAKVGQGWGETHSVFASAQSLAPWEPAFAWAEGRAALDHVVASGRADAFDDGAAAFTKAVKVLPQEPHLLRERADLYYAAGSSGGEEGLLSTALELYDAAISADPYNAVPLIGRGVTLIALGREEDAVLALEAAVGLAPRSEAAWHNLAVAYLRKGDAVRAQEALSQADALAKGN